MSAKLYKVRIFQLRTDFLSARVWSYWIAATSSAQAKKRAASQACGFNPKYPNVISAECWRGGASLVTSNDLRIS